MSIPRYGAAVLVGASATVTGEKTPFTCVGAFLSGARSRGFEALLPELLHDLCLAVPCALRNLEKTPEPTELRMADAAHWLVAAEPATGLSKGTIIQTLSKTQAQAQIDLVTNDSLFSELRRVTSERPFEGTALELLGKFQRPVWMDSGRLTLRNNSSIASIGAGLAK